MRPTSFSLTSSHPLARPDTSWCPSTPRSTPCNHPRRLYATKPSKSKPSSSTAAPDTETTREKEYLSWASTAGIQFPKVTQAYFYNSNGDGNGDGGLRGTKALSAIDAGELFITVPRQAALVVEPTGGCPCSDFVSSEYWKQAPWYIKMAVLVLNEAQQGKNSRVWGYIRQLPDSIDTPVRWTPQEISEIQYPPLEEDILRQQKQWKEQYQGFIQAAASPQAKSISWDKFVWAAENVRSRAFSGPYAGAPLGDRLKLGGAVASAGLAYIFLAHVPLEQALNGALAAAVFNLLYDIVLSNKLKWFALCPVIDAINHSSGVTSSIEYEYFKDNFVCSTDMAYGAGDQVFISYGKQTNSSLFQYYGFIEGTGVNPHDIYAIPDGQIQGADSGSVPIRIVVTANGNLSPESLQSARAACLGGGGGDEKEQELAMRRAIVSILEWELASKATSLEEDERMMQTKHLLSERKARAVEYRMDRKRLLLKAIAKAKKKAK